jgi:UDP:flavonoid glycosyltransferase YjiC (YdhE family)
MEEAARLMKNLLVISGSIGLGHITRDLAVARELRRIRNDLAISWIAAHPATLVLEQAGETLLPECREYANESAQAEAAASGFKLNLLAYLTKARGAWAGNVKLFEKLAKSGRFDAVLGDETYELNVAQMKDPSINPLPYFCLYDFIGMDVVSRNPVDRLLTYVWNRLWASDHKIYRHDRYQALFLGEPEDVADEPFDWFLPNRREYAKRYYHFAGYVLGFDPVELKDRRAVRARLNYGDEPLIVCSIGGTAVGRDLLELCGKAYPIVKRDLPRLRMVLVAGPRIALESLKVPAGVESRPYVPALCEHFAACDLAIVLGGGTSTLELTALKRPFLYFPLEGHAEQQVAVSERLKRHRAGERMVFSQTTPALLARKIVATLGASVDYADIPTDGARIVAQRVSAAL